MSRRAQEQRKHGCFFYGCLTSLLMVALLTAAVIGLNSYNRKRFAPLCESYFALLDKGDYQAAYDSLGAQWRNGNSYEDYRRFEMAVRAKLGSCRSRALTGVAISAGTGRDTLAQVTYKGDYENGNAVITFTFRKQREHEKGRTWSLEGVSPESPLLENLFRCAACGAELKGWARFCSKCGKAVVFDSDQASTVPMVEQITAGVEAAAGTTSTPEQGMRRKD